ncbi:hypothetical protein PMAYCL1PPCAC_02319, partial [Pristionchus mayeri]
SDQSDNEQIGTGRDNASSSNNDMPLFGIWRGRIEQQILEEESTESSPDMAEQADVPNQENEQSANPIVHVHKPPKTFSLGAFEENLNEAERFEGYKLKADQNTEGTWRVRLSTMVYRHVPSNRQQSIHHLRIFAEMNMLVVDPWSIRTIMTVRIFAILEDGCLHRIVYNSSRNEVGEITKVMTLYPPRRDRSLPPSLQFIYPTCAVVCDGGRVLSIYETNEDRTTWDKFFEYRVIGEQAPEVQPGCDRPPAGVDYGFTIVDARLTMPKQQIDVCLRAARDREGEDGSTTTETFVRWITIWMPDPSYHNWEHKRSKSIVCHGDVEFIGFDRSCDHLIVVSCGDIPPQVEEDEKTPSKGKEPLLHTERDNDAGDKIVYVWYQTEEEVKVVCRLDQENSHLFVKDDIIFEATENHLKIMAKGEIVVDGELGGAIDTNGTEWELLKPMEGTRRLEFSLKKESNGDSPRGLMAGTWTEVVKKDGKGKFIDDADDLEWSLQALDIEFVDNEKPISYFMAERDQAVTSSIEKLEDCDYDENIRFMWYLNETTNHIDYKCDLSGYPILFGTKAFPGLCQTRALCVREGYDGYVYNFEIFPPRNCQIMKVWGHVQHGKPRRKFTGVSPLGGYGFVVNSCEDAFVYWQTHNNTQNDIVQYKEVIHRKYGPNDDHPPMQIVCMRANNTDEEVDENILGCISTEDSLILLSCDTLVIHRLRVPPVPWATTAAQANLNTR